MAPATKALATGAKRLSKRILVSYILDWILIIVIAAIGAVFNQVVHNTNKRPFSLQDPSLSYPFRENTVSIGVVAVVALIVPAAVTMFISLVFIPGPTASKSTPKSLIWRRKFWEWNAAWMGLGLALASTFMITEGLKDLAGKPRPHAIARCNPDLTNIARYQIGGLGQSFDLSGATPILVTSDICQERDPNTLRDTFASWPSGHSSFSFAGLLYFSLFLCAKFGVGIPYFLPNLKTVHANTYEYDDSLRHPQQTITGRGSPTSASSLTTHNEGGQSSRASPPPRNSTAAPPIYLLILTVFLPVGVAIFICVSRWFDFHHHGLDILSGALLGSFCAYASFRYYHMPILRGSGWAWGARSRGRAFWAGVGRDGYVGEEGWIAAKAAKRQMTDLESGRSATAQHKGVTGAGIEDRGDVGGVNGAGRLDVSDVTGYTTSNQHHT